MLVVFFHSLLPTRSFSCFIPDLSAVAVRRHPWMFGLFGKTHRAGHTINQEYDEGDMVTALGLRKMSTNRGDVEQSPGPPRRMQTIGFSGGKGCLKNRQHASSIKSSSESPDFELPNKLQRLKSFLERHGFEGPENPRASNYSRIRMKPVYPIDVAEELGDKEMLEILGAHLSKRLSGSDNPNCLEQTSNHRSGYSDVGDEDPLFSQAV